LTLNSEELQSKGCKVTPQRRLILDILSRSELHVMTAEEIVNLARDQQPNISASTVYRNLGTLSELGLIKRLDSMGEGWRYEVSSGHHHHLVCLKCHNTVAIDFCPMNRDVKELAERSGFEVADHSFEIKGYCTNCQAESNRGLYRLGREIVVEHA
jgi:Fe2+ or Zn2+ uptake regulation protein